jgi:hypothetical protein
LALLSANCEAGTFESEWLIGLQALAEQTLAFSSPAAGRALFDSVLPTQCRQSLSRTVTTWLDLYLAVAARDAEAMALAAESALTGPTQGIPTQRVYAFGAALLGHFAAGNSARTLELWDQRSSFIGTEQTPPELDLIIAMARDPLSSSNVAGSAKLTDIATN